MREICKESKDWWRGMAPGQAGRWLVSGGGESARRRIRRIKLAMVCVRVCASARMCACVCMHALMGSRGPWWRAVVEARGGGPW